MAEPAKKIEDLIGKIEDIGLDEGAAALTLDPAEKGRSHPWPCPGLSY